MKRASRNETESKDEDFAPIGESVQLTQDFVVKVLRMGRTKAQKESLPVLGAVFWVSWLKSPSQKSKNESHQP